MQLVESEINFWIGILVLLAASKVSPEDAEDVCPIKHESRLFLITSYIWTLAVHSELFYLPTSK